MWFCFWIIFYDFLHRILWAQVTKAFVQISIRKFESNAIQMEFTITLHSCHPPAYLRKGVFLFGRVKVWNKLLYSCNYNLFLKYNSFRSEVVIFLHTMLWTTSRVLLEEMDEIAMACNSSIYGKVVVFQRKYYNKSNIFHSTYVYLNMTYSLHKYFSFISSWAQLARPILVIVNLVIGYKLI